nr:hypothetical protein [Pyrinomonadaceae bacterium]
AALDHSSKSLLRFVETIFLERSHPFVEYGFQRGGQLLLRESRRHEREQESYDRRARNAPPTFSIELKQTTGKGDRSQESGDRIKTVASALYSDC